MAPFFREINYRNWGNKTLATRIVLKVFIKTASEKTFLKMHLCLSTILVAAFYEDYNDAAKEEASANAAFA